MGKSLCLVLALVFVLGLCTVGSNAAFADYSDLDKVTAEYGDAVEILSGLLIIDGYPDGTFGPEKNVTRAEAAAMIARMMLGREAADKLPVGEVKFSDVAEDSWAAKYIAFCANKGIIVGMGNGTFCPNDNITGTQMAAMLLRALGYDAMGEYQGKGWDINAVADALYYGVFNDSKVVDFNQPATREEMALYIWNTMWINLVGYDVDLNYYKEKERLSDGKIIGITFADDAFDLKELSYDSKTNAGTYVVLANQATGDKYTVVGRYMYWNPLYDEDGKFVRYRNQGWRAEYYLDYATDLDWIGHEVTVFIEDNELTDEKEHLDYYKCYLIKDESETIDLPFGAKLDDFYRAAKAFNKNNLDVYFTNVMTLNNYDYTQQSWYDEWLYGDRLGFIMDGDDYYAYYTIGEVKGQKSSNDSAPMGTWIVDHAGNVLVVLTGDYRVAKVTEVDTDHEEVVLDIWLQDDDIYVDGPFDMKWNDIDLVTYDGIAKGDYVQVAQVGKLFYINQTTTKTVDVTEMTTYGWFNNYAFIKDSYSYGTDDDGNEIHMPIPDCDDWTDIGVGDKVKFYVIEGASMFLTDSYFGVQIMEKAKSEGIVYINFIGEFIEHGEWDTIEKEEGENADQAKLNTIIKVQGINQEGEEVVYKFTQKKWEKLSTEPEVGGIYEVRKQGNSYFFDDSERALKNVVKLENKGTSGFLLSDNNDGSSDIYYVTGDTKVIYWTGEGADLDIEVVSKLAKPEKGESYEVWALAKKSGGSFKMISVWVLDKTIEAPDDYPDEGYIYVANKRRAGGTSKSGSVWHNDKSEDKYSVYQDGQKITAFVTGEDIFLSGGILKYAFYQYVENDDGILELKKVEKNTRYGVVLGKDKKGNVLDGSVVDGRLFAKNSNGASLKGVTFVDISGDTTSGTRTDTNVIDVDTLETMLAEGYQITCDYMYVKDDEGNEAPVGVVYVTNVQTPAGERGSF